MRILEGLHTTKIRWLKWNMRRANGQGRGERFYTSARTSNALALVPGSDGDEMWAAHTEVIYRQWKAEELTRKKELA